MGLLKGRSARGCRALFSTNRSVHPPILTCLGKETPGASFTKGAERSSTEVTTVKEKRVAQPKKPKRSECIAKKIVFVLTK
jgi:hypothetical protein